MNAKGRKRAPDARAAIYELVCALVLAIFSSGVCQSSSGWPDLPARRLFLWTFPFESFFPRSARIRSKRLLAGSSAGSCGTSLPSKARLRIDWRSRAARLRFASTTVSSSSMMEI
jgi:hypothetical protein